MKYDDSTLIKFVNDELEADQAQEIQNEINNDEELKERVKVFSFMTYEKIRHANMIIDLIDNNEPSLKEIAISKINERKRKFKIRIGVISSIFAVVIGFSLMPQVATKGVNFLDNNSASISILNVSEERLV
jgi:outer membrane phospholipase A